MTFTANVGHVPAGRDRDRSDFIRSDDRSRRGEGNSYRANTRTRDGVHVPAGRDHYQREYVDRSRRIANHILSPDDGVIHKIGHVRWDGCYPSFNILSVNTRVSSRIQRGNDPADTTRFFVGLIGTVVGGFALFSIGRTYNHLVETTKEISTINTFTASLNDVAEEKKEKYLEIASHHKAIFSRIRNNAIVNLAMLVGMVASSVFLIAGAIFASGGLMITGGIIGLIIGGAALLKWGLDSTDTYIKEHAEAMEQELDLI
ncbi:MAG: hypothetical protein H7A37_03315 [Chlamydiales bacterium]|nr:hypothetical protein [Chlamydiales bacterium]